MLIAIGWMTAACASAQDSLQPALETTYQAWREAMIHRDTTSWQKTTAEHRRMEIKNRIVSEKRAFPAALFELPAPPPSLSGLKFLSANQNGATAKAAYFGKIDFGVGGEPSDNLLVLSFTRAGTWLYDRADFINLTALPGVRKELAAGDLKYLKETPEVQATGVVPPTPIEARAAKYIAKVYVFCPGREVRVQINKISRHRFANAKEAEIVIGGALDGSNEVQFYTQKLPGATGKEVMTLRVYLLSEVKDVPPIKAFEYQIAAGESPKSFSTTTFTLDAAMASKLSAR
jgi:hypothetical protein